MSGRRPGGGRGADPYAEEAGGAFDAWALPSWASVEGTESLRPAGGAEVRYPVPDPDWTARLAAGLAAGRSPVAAGRSPLAASPLERAALLGRVGARFLDRDDPLRGAALRLLPATSGLSAPMAGAVLEGMAADWTAERLERLLVEELGEAARGGRQGRGMGGGFADRGRGGSGRESTGGRRSLPVGPRLCVQLVAGSVPGVGVSALLRSLLVGAPTLLKPGLGDVVLPVLFARGLREASPALADELAVVYWPGGSEEVERAALGEAEVAVVYGGDDTVVEVRRRTPATTRLVEYHHREGIGVVGSEALGSTEAAAAVAEDVAWAVSIFDQRGCVSPRVVYVEAPEAESARGDAARGGVVVTPADFAGLLAGSLERLEARLPSGALDGPERAALQQLRGTAELLGAAGRGVTLAHGGTRPWTVVHDPDGRIDANCVGRSVVVRPFRHPGELAARLGPRASHLQTVGAAGLGERLEALTSELGRLGVSRVTPFRTVPFPPAWWHHDGRGPLLDLVRWVDLEGG